MSCSCHFCWNPLVYDPFNRCFKMVPHTFNAIKGLISEGLATYYKVLLYFIYIGLFHNLAKNDIFVISGYGPFILYARQNTGLLWHTTVRPSVHASYDNISHLFPILLIGHVVTYMQCIDKRGSKWAKLFSKLSSVWLGEVAYLHDGRTDIILRFYEDGWKFANENTSIKYIGYTNVLFLWKLTL
jgi:hypothetical protein